MQAARDKIARCVICGLPLLTSEEAQIHAGIHFNFRQHHSGQEAIRRNKRKQNMDEDEDDENSIVSSDSKSPVYYNALATHGLTASQGPSNRPSSAVSTGGSSDQVYQCIKCQQCFATEADIKHHVSTHLLQEGNRHDCFLCNKVFESPAKLQCHLIEHTFTSADYTCYLCATAFDTAAELQAHAIQHGIHARHYKCSQCLQAFFFSAELQNHLYTHSTSLTADRKDNYHARGSWTISNKVGQPQQHQHQLQQQPQPHHQQQYVQQEKPEKRLRLECALCDGAFSTLADLKAHLRRVHPGASKRQPSSDVQVYQCSECGTKFLSENEWKRHRQAHIEQGIVA